MKYTTSKMKGALPEMPLMVVVILLLLLVGIGTYLILFQGSAGDLISWVSPFAQGIPDMIG